MSHTILLNDSPAPYETCGKNKNRISPWIDYPDTSSQTIYRDTNHAVRAGHTGRSFLNQFNPTIMNDSTPYRVFWIKQHFFFNYSFFLMFFLPDWYFYFSRKIKCCQTTKGTQKLSQYILSKGSGHIIDYIFFLFRVL